MADAARGGHLGRDGRDGFVARARRGSDTVPDASSVGVRLRAIHNEEPLVEIPSEPPPVSVRGLTKTILSACDGPSSDEIAALVELLDTTVSSSTRRDALERFADAVERRAGLFGLVGVEAAFTAAYLRFLGSVMFVRYRDALEVVALGPPSAIDARAAWVTALPLLERADRRAAVVLDESAAAVAEGHPDAAELVAHAVCLVARQRDVPDLVYLVPQCIRSWSARDRQAFTELFAIAVERGLQAVGPAAADAFSPLVAPLIRVGLQLR